MTGAFSRRRFLAAAALAGANGAVRAGGSPLDGVSVGVMDTTLRLAGNVSAIAAARRLGFDGLQVSIGLDEPDGRLHVAHAEVQAQYLAESRKCAIPLTSTYLNILHRDCLKSDASAARWVAQGIEITRALQVRILMLVFFGKCALEGDRDLDAVTGVLKELAPQARRAGVVLGFENTLSARDNARVLDGVASDALQVFYDVGNSTN